MKSTLLMTISILPLMFLFCLSAVLRVVINTFQNADRILSNQGSKMCDMFIDVSNS